MSQEAVKSPDFLPYTSLTEHTADLSAVQCDGNKPCGRCRSRQGVECVYEPHVRQPKDDLRDELEMLRQRQRSADLIFSGLLLPNIQEGILSRLRNRQSIGHIYEWLRELLPPARNIASGTSSTLVSWEVDNIMATHVHSSAATNVDELASATVAHFDTPTTKESLREASTRNTHVELGQGDFASSVRTDSKRVALVDAKTGVVRNQDQPHLKNEHAHPFGASSKPLRYLTQNLEILDVYEQEIGHVVETWTTITGDIDLVKHLLALYFCWEYPTFASLSKEHFLGDFRDGRPRYCSSILVNALLALGCRFSTRPETRTKPGDAYSSGDHFFSETQRLFHQESDHHSITTVQALGIMSIREAGCGRDTESMYYAGQSMRLALEMGLHRTQPKKDEGERAVQSATFWGAFALDQ